MSESFDYSVLVPAVQDEVKQAAERIRVEVQRTTEGIIIIGRELLQVKAKLGYGFHSWLKAEFTMSARTADRFMSVATRFPSNTYDKLSHIPPSALYLLAGASDEAVEKIVQKAEEKQPITIKEVKQVMREAPKPPPIRKERPLRRHAKPQVLPPLKDLFKDSPRIADTGLGPGIDHDGVYRKVRLPDLEGRRDTWLSDTGEKLIGAMREFIRSVPEDFTEEHIAKWLTHKPQRTAHRQRKLEETCDKFFRIVVKVRETMTKARTT